MFSDCTLFKIGPLSVLYIIIIIIIMVPDSIFILIIFLFSLFFFNLPYWNVASLKTRCKLFIDWHLVCNILWKYVIRPAFVFTLFVQQNNII